MYRKAFAPRRRRQRITQQANGAHAEQDEGGALGNRQRMLISNGSPATHIKPSIASIPAPEGVAARVLTAVNVWLKLPPPFWRNA